jgi:hypothetical protein
VQTLHSYYVKAKVQEETGQEVNITIPKMVWADFAFFEKWYSQADSATLEMFHTLLDNGTFGIEHGGWVQHDEATPDYKMIINMFDNGLQFLKNTFDILPRMGFSIDGFGHSSLTPYIYNALNLEGIVMWRIPIEIDTKTRADHLFRWLWEGDDQE